jgi:hypothetical protein
MVLNSVRVGSESFFNDFMQGVALDSRKVAIFKGSLGGVNPYVFM